MCGCLVSGGPGSLLLTTTRTCIVNAARALGGPENSGRARATPSSLGQTAAVLLVFAMLCPSQRVCNKVGTRTIQHLLEIRASPFAWPKTARRRGLLRPGFVVVLLSPPPTSTLTRHLEPGAGPRKRQQDGCWGGAGALGGSRSKRSGFCCCCCAHASSHSNLQSSLLPSHPFHARATIHPGQLKTHSSVGAAQNGGCLGA